MNKIKFGGEDIFGRKTNTPYPVKEEYMLLSYFIDDIKYDIKEVIGELEMVQKGERNFEDFLDDSEGWTIADGLGGIFTCKQKTAYFTANQDSRLSSMQMPLKELIEILYEWKAFLGK